jgi:predicted transcriptional regulator of viral defense system
MHDTLQIDSPDARRLFDISSEQRGYFTAEQARGCGYSWALLAHHARSGKFVRIQRGLYRLRDYPTAPGDEVVAAWLATGKDVAVVSHDSALEWLGLSDVVPDTIHLSLPRARRFHTSGPGVTVHTVSQPLGRDEVIRRDGLPLTSAARTIVDVARTGTAPEQVIAAVHQAIKRGLATRDGLEMAARRGGERVARLIRQAIEAEAAA